MLSGKVLRDFLFKVLFMNHILSGPSSAILISSKIHEDIRNLGFTTSTSGKLTTSVVDTGDKFTTDFKDIVGHIDLGDTGNKFASSVIRDISTINAASSKFADGVNKTTGQEKQQCHNAYTLK